ncbi:VOC family protein [Streptomyces microflavus]|uniref:VOC family protein n=1 Tax=Streptomyces microflavus TaxID=1919 RepID=UPI003B22276B
MPRIGIPVPGVTHVARAAAFWTAELHLDVSPQWHSETWRALSHRDGKGPALGLMHSTSPPEPRPRLHLDLFMDTAEEQRREVRRLVGLGTRTVDWDLYPPEPDFVVLADPEDNLILCGGPQGGGRRPGPARRQVGRSRLLGTRGLSLPSAGTRPRPAPAPVTRDPPPYNCPT